MSIGQQYLNNRKVSQTSVNENPLGRSDSEMFRHPKEQALPAKNWRLLRSLEQKIKLGFLFSRVFAFISFHSTTKILIPTIHRTSLNFVLLFCCNRLVFVRFQFCFVQMSLCVDVNNALTST